MNTPNAAALTQHLQQDIQACETLLQLLEQERTALSERDLESMEAIIEKKATCLSLLEQSAKNRTAWSQQFVTSDAQDQQAVSEAWQTLLQQTNQQQLVDQWQQLKTLQSACKKANEVNGKILARNQKTFGRLLEIVRGQTASPSLYSTAGKATSSHISHKIGEA